VKECRQFFLNAMGLPADLWITTQTPAAKPVAASRPTRSIPKSSPMSPLKQGHPDVQPTPALAKRSVA
jgi:hypothetical protein